MNDKPSLIVGDDHITGNQIENLLRDHLSSEETLRIEQHLTQCDRCVMRVERTAAHRSLWERTTSMLTADEFDGAATRSTLTQLIPTDSYRPKYQSTLLQREIRGWLDPTDDPAMLGRFAGYEIVGIIGHGGMGIVLKGFEPSLNRYVAIKVLAPRLASNATARRRFEREAQAAAAVVHENVIAIHRVDQWHELPFLVMPYVGGESLQQRIDRRGPLSLESTLCIGAQIAHGLAAAHDRNLVHRDIKPANILLQPGIDRLHITNFGLARTVDDVSLTRTGVVAGTPEYMSPEQAAGEPIGPQSDLFSLGSVLFACLTGRSPFRSPSPVESIDAIKAGKRPTLRQLEPSVPVWMESFIDRLLSVKASRRPANSREVAETLSQCLLHVQSPDRPLPSTLRRQRQFAWRTWLTFSLAAVVLIICCILLAPFLTDRDVGEAPLPSAAALENVEDVEPAHEEALQQVQQSITEIEALLDEFETQWNFKSPTTGDTK